MKKFILAAMAALFAAGAMAQVAVPAPGTFENYIQVTGKAEKSVVPDQIYVGIVIDEKEIKVKQTVENLEKQMISKLKSLGIDTDKNLVIDNMSSDYKDYFLKRNTVRTAATYQLVVGDAVMLGKVYQAMESLDISNINIVKLSHSNIKQFQEEVRIEAIKNARDIALSLAEAIGQEAGKAVHIVDYNGDFYIPVPQSRGYVMYDAVEKSSKNYYETELNFKEIKLTYNITAKFVLN